MSLTKREILSHVTTRVNLEDMMLSKISLLQKDKYFITSLV